MYRMSPIQPWLEALDKRPGERTMTDVQYVAELLRSITTLRDLPHELILDLASCAYLEDLEEGVTLFRQGDRGTNWYAVLSGSVSAFASRDASDKLRQGVESSCLRSGATFGESVLTDSPRHLTMVTREPCQLVRIEQRDFRKLWHKNKTALRELLQAPTSMTSLGSDRVITGGGGGLDERRSSGGSSPGARRTSSPRVTPRDVTPREPVSPCSSCHGTPASRRARARSPSPPRRRQLPCSPSPPAPITRHHGETMSEPALDAREQRERENRDPREPREPREQRDQRENRDRDSRDPREPRENRERRASLASCGGSVVHPSPPPARRSPPKPRESPTEADTNGNGLRCDPSPMPVPVPMLADPVPDPGQEELGDGLSLSPEPERDGELLEAEAGGSQRSVSPRRSLTPSPEETVPRPRLPYSLLAAQPLVQEPSDELVDVGRTLRTLLLVRCPQLVRDRKYRLHTFRRCMVGTEMVDWLLQLSTAIRSRQQAAAIWQVMLEQGLVLHVTREHPFRDKYLFYRFRDDVDVIGSMNPTSCERREAEARLPSALAVLQRRAPDALIRLILRKPSSQRTAEDLEMVYEELMHIKALAHLTNSVKRELAGVIVFESHLKAGTVLFNQGDEGQSWYIILRGSVNVVIHGKGTVTTLNDGDDFGNLALINDAPRAATIVCREDSCFFLRVDKEDFNRILRDVEANTVRLKEHGKDVLVLEKLAEPGTTAQFKYSVMAGTPQKMLEHLLETRFSGCSETRPSDITISDLFLDDFLLTHVIFFPFKELTEELINKYRACQESNPDGEYVLACKRRVIRFLHQWASTIREPVLEDLSGINSSFLEDLYHLVEADATTYGPLFRDETHLMMDLMEMREKARQERQSYGVRKWKMPAAGHRVTLFSGNSIDEEMADRVRPMQHHDEMIFRVYCADHTFCTLKFPLSASAAAVRRSAADKLGLSNDDLLLVQLKSSGERMTLKDTETSVTTGLSLNGRLFVSPKDHLDALTPLPEQEGPTENSTFDVEAHNTRDLAIVMTQLDWEAFNKIHEYEILYHVTGREQQGRTTANLDVFLCRFTEYQHWVITEICLCSNLNRRVALLKKFIKLATACRELKNLNAFFALVMGLSNSAVSRLTLTWEKLPSKFRKMYSTFELLIDPTRNHRAYRVYMADLLPPIIPFMPLLIKDMTFTHDGNPTRVNGLVNFEKMHMLAQTMRTLRYCRSRPLASADSDQLSRIESEIRRQLRTLHVIDNQKIINALSQKLESRRT